MFRPFAITSPLAVMLLLFAGEASAAPAPEQPVKDDRGAAKSDPSGEADSKANRAPKDRSDEADKKSASSKDRPADEESPAATAARVVRGMESARERISERKTGSDTQKLQRQVLNDLQSLIDLAGRMQQSQPRQPDPSQSESQGSPQGSQEPQQAPSQADSGQGGPQRKEDDSGANSTEATGDSSRRQVDDSRRRQLLGEVWGHLPEALRQRLLNDLGEKTLPGYDDLVRRYFEALAEQAKPASNSSEKKLE